MKPKLLLSCIALAGLTSFATGAFAQAPRVEFPAASPSATIKQRVGLTDVEIVYSRPSVKGREIFGGLVPHGEVWRTGANSPTKITFSTPVKLNGSAVPAGSYSLWSIPGEGEWTVIISKGTSQRYEDKDDVVRLKVKAVKLSESVETFTIDINDLRDESATINVSWDKVRVPLKLELDLASKLIPQIKELMSSDATGKPYFQAAAFYYDHNVDMNKAKEWAEIAVKEREAYFTVHLKAKILAKLGDKQGAIAAANRSTELARTANASGYVKLNADVIAGLK